MSAGARAGSAPRERGEAGFESVEHDLAGLPRDVARHADEWRAAEQDGAVPRAPNRCIDLGAAGVAAADQLGNRER